MKKSKFNPKPIIAFCILAVLIAGILLVYYQFKPKAVEGSKKITVAVIIPEEETKEFTIYTNAEYLSQALEDENLIKGKKSTYGLFITEVNGRAIDSSKNEWWQLSKDGEMLNTGADQTPIADGDHYEITLSTY